MVEVTSRRMECTLLTPDFSQVPAVALQALLLKLEISNNLRQLHAVTKKKVFPHVRSSQVIGYIHTYIITF